MDTNEITTPTGGVVVVLKEWISARDFRQIKEVMFGVADVDVTGNIISKINPEKVIEMENKTLEMVVISVGGETENIVEKLLDLHAADYEYVLQEVNSIAGIAEKKRESE